MESIIGCKNLKIRKGEMYMNITEPLTQGRKSLLAKKYVTREIDGIL